MPMFPLHRHFQEPYPKFFTLLILFPVSILPTDPANSAYEFAGLFTGNIIQRFHFSQFLPHIFHQLRRAQHFHPASLLQQFHNRSPAVFHHDRNFCLCLILAHHLSSGKTVQHSLEGWPGIAKPDPGPFHHKHFLVI